MTPDDPALGTLLLPFQRELLQWPAGTAFLRARCNPALLREAPPQLVCEQTFKPDADALSSAGLTVTPSLEGRHALVLVLPPRQRDEARALIARAIDMIQPGGRVVVAQGNNEGARSIEQDLARIAGPLQTLTKNRCRVFWTEPLDGPINAALCAEWLALDAVRPIGDGRFVSRPGLFAWDRIDAASALLARHLPSDLRGSAADLGAGFGYLSAGLLDRCNRLERIDLYEAEARALDLARINLRAHESRVNIHYHWHDVTAGLPHEYDIIVTNPPFHTGAGRERPDIGRRFIAVAAEALKSGGQLWLVANRHLPYETALSSGFGQVRTVAQEAGFKIIQATRR